MTHAVTSTTSETAAYAVDTFAWLGNPISRSRIGEYHDWVFHGEAFRGDASALAAWAEGRSFNDMALELVRSGVFIPPVFSPGGVPLIVNESIAEKLNQYESLRLRSVRFRTLVDIVATKGDMSHEEWFRKRSDSWIDRLSLMAMPKEQWFEVQMPVQTHTSVRGWPQDNLHWVQYRMTPSAPSDKLLRVALSSAICNRFPLFECNATMIVSSKIMQMLDDHLDRDFYRVISLPI